MDQAETAFRVAHENDPAASSLSDFLRERYGMAMVLAWADAQVAGAIARLGDSHPVAIEARAMRAWQRCIAGDGQKARLELANLVPLTEAVYGKTHRRSLEMRFGAAYWLAEAGDRAVGNALLNDLAQECSRLLGMGNSITSSIRFSQIRWMLEDGSYEGAITQIDDRLEEIALYPDPHMDTNREGLIMFKADCLSKLGNHEQAIGLMGNLLRSVSGLNGVTHSQSNYVRRRLAELIGETGQPERAATLMKELQVEQALRRSDEAVLDDLIIGRELAHWTGKAGKPAEAARQLDDLAKWWAAKRGSDDGYALGLRRRQAEWVARAGQAQIALALLQDLASEISSMDGLHEDIMRHVTAQIETLQHPK